jgi:hypothetical protein
LRGRCAAAFLIIATICPPVALAGPASKDRVSGEIREVEGVRVLRIWGSPRERGYAHGYLLGSDIIKLLDGYLGDERISGGPQRYEASLQRIGAMMKIERRYVEEMRGLYEGVVAKLGDKATIQALARPIRYEDVVAMNCIPDSTRMGCSSFAAWGDLTKRGATLSGRNLDWHRIPALSGSGIAIAYVSRQKTEKSWVSITWPGYVGCLTGMNADGITLSMHDVPAGPPSVPGGFTPRGLILREAIESATGDGPRAMKKIGGVLEKRVTCVGNNIPVSSPFKDARHPPSGVFEFDGDVENQHGFELVVPKIEGGGDKFFQVCTNHYCERARPSACDRFQKMLQRLRSLKRDGKTMDVKQAWEVLRSVAFRNGPLETYYSVIFEPNARRMNVAFGSGGKPAPDCTPVTLDLAELLAR